MTDPFELSPDYRARMDQMAAATREAAGLLRAAVDELTADGWTDEQARTLVVFLVLSGHRP